ncbi:MAG: Bax inhibitor-1/YccA family protein [Clostridia bacterium]|nr:Bax inhibitor-1/YccA family protein [Clostridia bacterium]
MEESFDGTYIVENNKMMLRTFSMMFLGLLATALVAIYSYQTGMFLKVDYRVLGIIEIVVVLVFSLLLRKLPPAVVTALFFGYAALNGVTMGVIFALFDIGTIGLAFLSASGLFAGLAMYGYITKKDMTKLGTICSVALIVGLIVSVINLFLGFAMIDIALDWIILAIFAGITIYDIYRMKSNFEFSNIESEKLYVYFAMQLYLDFINIFLRILSIFARRRD